MKRFALLALVFLGVVILMTPSAGLSCLSHKKR